MRAEMSVQSPYVFIYACQVWFRPNAAAALKARSDTPITRPAGCAAPAQIPLEPRGPVGEPCCPGVSWTNPDLIPNRPSPNPPYSPPRSATPSTPSSPPTYGAIGGAAAPGDPLEIDCPACRLQVTPPTRTDRPLARRRQPHHYHSPLQCSSLNLAYISSLNSGISVITSQSMNHHAT